MGMFTHLGIGWELSWLMVIAAHSAVAVHLASDKAKMYYPSRTTKITATALAFGIPTVWWVVVALSMDAYASTGYFCWVKFSPIYISLLFGDIPLFICCVFVSTCYLYVIYKLVKLNFVSKQLEGVRFRKEIRRSVLYIIVYGIWVHPYLAVTITSMAGKNISRGLWIYFLAIINSMGILNFFAYGLSEQWYRDIRQICGCAVVDSSDSTRGSKRASQQLSIDVTSENDEESSCSFDTGSRGVDLP
jgi:hypothetical protein